jgi:hypothetical protein
MAMELQDLVMFRDSLQQPSNTGLQNLDLLNKLTFQSMGSQEYMNQPMMNTGLMSMPVAQAGFGGFIKSITRAPARIVKGATKAVKNIVKSPVGSIALGIAAPYALPALFPALAGSPLLTSFLAGTGTSLLGGAKPGDAIKRGGLAALTTGLTRGFTTPKPGVTSSMVTGPDPSMANYTGNVPLSSLSAPPAETNIFKDLLRGATDRTYDPEGTVLSRLGQRLSGAGQFEGARLGEQLGLQPGTAEAQAEEVLTGIESQRYQDFAKSDPTNIVNQTYQPKIAEAVTQTADKGLSLDSITGALRKGVDFAKDNKLLTGGALLGGLALLSGEEIPQDQLNMAGITKETIGDDFDKQRFVYKDAQGNPLTTAQALQMIQSASQGFGEGGQRMASGVRGTFERVDPVLSASGGLIGMAYGGSMPMNNMDVKYKEFSGMVGGEGTGMEDNVYMPIVEGEQGQQVATLAVSPKEYVVDANTMSLLGNGNPDEGAEIMDKTVKDIRMAATGQTKQQKEIDGLASLNRMRRSV